MTNQFGLKIPDILKSKILSGVIELSVAYSIDKLTGKLLMSVYIHTIPTPTKMWRWDNNFEESFESWVQRNFK